MNNQDILLIYCSPFSAICSKYFWQWYQNIHFRIKLQSTDCLFVTIGQIYINLLLKCFALC